MKKMNGWIIGYPLLFLFHVHDPKKTPGRVQDILGNIHAQWGSLCTIADPAVPLP